MGKRHRKADRAVTHEEVAKYSATETLFKSNLFQLQEQELLREVCPFSAAEPPDLSGLEQGVRALYAEPWESVLRRARLFRGLTARELGSLLSLGKPRVYPRYSRLVREGQVASTCFVVLSGSVVTYSSKGGVGSVLRPPG